jgi:polysaccharide pyruvyl transferase WcaK-like protein
LKRNKILYLVFAIFVIAIVVMSYFNLTFSLPTTFKAVVEKQISQDEQLSFTNLDTERIDSIRIEAPKSSSAEDVEIDDKDVISGLLSNDLRIYKGGRLKESSKEYDLYINFYGSIQRYTIAEDYIKTFDGNYKVLDENNEIYNYLHSLFEQK